MIRKLFSSEARSFSMLQAARKTPVRPLTDADKRTKLAKAIVGAAAKSGTASIRDGIQAGLSEKDVTKFWDGAVTEARRIDAAVMDAVQP